MIVIGCQFGEGGGGGEEMADAIQTRSDNILILSLNLGSLCDESQSLVYCALLFNWALKLQVSALKSQI